MVFIAHFPADRIAQRQYTALVILFHQLSEMLLHPLQHFLSRMLLYDHEFIAAEAGEKAVAVQNTRKIGRKGLDELIALLMAIIIIDPLQSIEIKHHDPDVQGVTPLLQLLEMPSRKFP